ncbi:MAG: hypothetical protein V3V00_15905 [Saprospiraceae bacterium]
MKSIRKIKIIVDTEVGVGLSDAIRDAVIISMEGKIDVDINFDYRVYPITYSDVIGFIKKNPCKGDVEEKDEN